MVYKIVEISTDKASGHAYALVHFWRRKAAAIVNNPGDLELKARAELIKSWLVKLDDLHLPLLLASELEGPP